jgi:hypothetical protein
MKTSQLITELCSLSTESIPEQWEKIALYGEINDYSRTVFFYFKPKNRSEWIYSLDFEDIYDSDEEKLDASLTAIEHKTAEIWESIKKETGKPFSWMTLIINESGKFEINYSYEKPSDSPVEQKKRWKEQYLKLN